MIRWFHRYYEASRQTKFFIWNWAIYGIALLITTIYCYGRLDFVRSYPAPSTVQAEKINQENRNNP